MINTKFQDLRRKKEYVEKRDLSLRIIAAETGLALATVQRVSSGRIEKVYLSTLDAFCKYFEVENISDLIEYVPDSKQD